MAIDRPLLNPIKHAARLITLTTTRLASSSTASEHQGLVVSPPLSPTQAAFANKTFAKPARFVTSVFHARQLPDSKKPEVAIVGRSNVGKSTLINRLTNRAKLAKTSSKPGHTRALNFFDIDDVLRLVDMPGYGFRSREEWGDLILEYFKSRKQLRRVFIVVDLTAGIKETDKQLMHLLDEQPLPYQIILSKCDKLSAEALGQAKSRIEEYLGKNAICWCPPLLVTGKRRAKNDPRQVAQDLSRLRWAILAAANITPQK